MKQTPSGAFTPEMRQWLTDNREDYEFYMLHAMLHDPLRRAALLAVPVEPLDFRREEYGLVVAALHAATKVMRVIGRDVASPPTVEFMRTYIESAAREDTADDEVVADAMKLVTKLQDASFCDQHYCVSPFFEAWYGAARAKRAARELQRTDIPDVAAVVERLQTVLAAAGQLDAALDECKFDFDNIPERPEPILKLGDDIICTPGNLSNIQGPPKAAKSAAVGAIMAAALREPNRPADTLGFTVEPPAGRAVLHFDTEQSAHDHDALVRRAYTRARRMDRAPWLDSYCLTGMEPPRCWDVLSRALKKANDEHGGVMIIIIDGIADFCTDPNDAQEAFGLVRRLHDLAIRHDCAIITVLHENPGSDIGKMRGHLGSHLERKAETPLRLQKDANEIVTMWSDRARHCHIPKSDGTCFRWGAEEEMHISCGNARDVKKDTERENYAVEVADAFGANELLTYTELKLAIMEAVPCADPTAKKRIAKYVKLGLVEKGGDGRYQRASNTSPTEKNAP